MKIVCISKNVHGLTLGNHYEMIDYEDTRGNYLVVNDFGESKWYDRCPLGVIEVLPTTDKWLEYIDHSNSNLTNGKSYQLLYRNYDDYSKYIYFLDDNNHFVGVSKTNLYGEPVFKNTRYIREQKLKQILE